MDNKVDAIFSKLENLDNKIDSVDKHLAVYNEQLKIHIKRTTMLEEDVRPIKDHVNQLKGAGKFVVYISIGLGIIATLITLLNK